MKKIKHINRIILGILLAVSTVHAVTPTVPVTNPLSDYYYSLEVPGILGGYFTDVSRVGSESEVIDHLISGLESQKVPGRTSMFVLTVKRDITSNTDAWVWRKMVEDGNIEEARQNISIIMYDQELAIIAEWSLENAWPAKISAYADADGFAVEELVIVYEGYSRIQ